MEHTTSPLVLLLEDEALIAVDLEFTLRSAGFSVVMFAHCAHAEHWLEAHSPDLAIIDITLADGVCINAASTLMERGIPFIVHSAHSEILAYKDTAFEGGLWIGKPAAIGDLIIQARKLAAISLV